jgi:hypothetical protein
MQELFIHIGLHKTATTFLQDEIFPNLEGLHYTRKEDITELIREITIHDQTISNIDSIKDRLAATFSGDRNLISGESLSGNPFLQYINRTNTLDKLRSMFPNAKIIIGIRSQVGIIASMYKQYIKCGGVKTLSDLTAPPMDIHQPAYEYFNLSTFKYNALIKKIEDCFGRDNLYIYVYEDLIDNQARFLSGLLNFLGATLPTIKPQPKNISPSDSEICLMRIANMIFRTLRKNYGLPRPLGYYTVIRFLGKFLYRSSQIISPEFARKLKDFYRHDNEILDKDYQLSLKKQFNKQYF